MNQSAKIPVTFFFRKPQQQYHSIERVFSRIIENLPDQIQSDIYTLKNGDKGIISRLKAIKECRQNRSIINHITGDISFVAIGLPRKGLIITFHDLESLERKNKIISYLLKLFWVKIPVRRAKAVTVISEHTREQVMKWAGIGEDKITVIHNPLPEGFVHLPKEFNSQQPNILCIGTKQNKNLEGIIKGVEDINCKLIILGHLQPQQLELLQEYQISYENRYGISDDELIKVYQQCDMLCFPSFYEGFGMPIIEAQATGRAVITSNYGAMREVAGEGALLVDPHDDKHLTDAIKRICKNTDLRKELITKGVENAMNYNALNIGREYCKLYIQLNRK